MLSLAALLASSASATVIAFYDFDPDNVSGTTADVDGSTQADWTTTALIDQATGTGALGASNQASANRDIYTGSTDNYLGLSSNREGDAQTPLTAGGSNESTWLRFSITPDPSISLNFTGHDATVDTYSANSGVGSTTSTDWTLYYSLNGGTSWSSLGTSAGATSTGTPSSSGPVALTWDLDAIGAVTSAVEFIIDPVSTGGTNGAASQRRTGMDNLTVNATVTTVPETTIALLGSLGLLGLLRRRR